MYIILILFFTSLLGIVFVFGRKLSLVRGGMVANGEHFHPFIPDFLKVKYLAKRGLKKYGYLLLVTTLRFYFRIANLIKYQYQKMKTQIKETILKHTADHTGNATKEREVSGFLKMISEYKYKIRNIKHKIREEEKIKK